MMMDNPQESSQMYLLIFLTDFQYRTEAQLLLHRLRYRPAMPLKQTESVDHLQTTWNLQRRLHLIQQQPSGMQPLLSLPCAVLHQTDRNLLFQIPSETPST